MARRTMYSLMGAGLHGRRWFKPSDLIQNLGAFWVTKSHIRPGERQAGQKRHRRLGEIPTWAAETNPVTAG